MQNEIMPAEGSVFSGAGSGGAGYCHGFCRPSSSSFVRPRVNASLILNFTRVRSSSWRIFLAEHQVDIRSRDTDHLSKFNAPVLILEQRMRFHVEVVDVSVVNLVTRVFVRLQTRQPYWVSPDVIADWAQTS